MLSAAFARTVSDFMKSKAFACLFDSMFKCSLVGADCFSLTTVVAVYESKLTSAKEAMYFHTLFSVLSQCTFVADGNFCLAYHNVT